MNYLDEGGVPLFPRVPEEGGTFDVPYKSAKFSHAILLLVRELFHIPQKLLLVLLLMACFLLRTGCCSRFLSLDLRLLVVS